jgi:hypothetical protein
MSQVEKDARRQLAKVHDEAKDKFLSLCTVDRHQKIIKHGEIEIASLLFSLHIPNVSKYDDI